SGGWGAGAEAAGSHRGGIAAGAGGGGAPAARKPAQRRQGAADSLGPDRSREPRGVGRKAGEDGGQLRGAEVARQDLPEQVAEVGRHGEVAPLETARWIESRPFAEHFAAVHGAAQREHRRGVAVIGADVAVLVDSA